MNILKAFIAATTFTLLSGALTSRAYAAEGDPHTTFTLYHQAESSAATRSTETRSADTRSADNGISVYDAKINLLDDYDHDGHYSKFEVIYDADDLSGHGLYAYTVVSLVDDDGYQRTLFTSPTFYIYGDTNGDAQSHQVTLLDEYETGHFRLRIDLYDACCGEQLDTLITSTQSPIPLEGQYYDTITTYTNTYVEETYYEEDSGAGGSWGIGGLGALGLLFLLRRKSLDALLHTEDEDEDV